MKVSIKVIRSFAEDANNGHEEHNVYTKTRTRCVRCVSFVHLVTPHFQSWAYFAITLRALRFVILSVAEGNRRVRKALSQRAQIMVTKNTTFTQRPRHIVYVVCPSCT